MSENNIPKPQWFSIKEAANYLEVGEPTLYRWMRDGKITYRKVGDSTRFLQEDLDGVVVVHRQTQENFADFRCNYCGSESMVSGKLQSTGLLYFVPEKSKFWTFATSTIGLKSMMCSKCGHIELKGDTQHLNKLMGNGE